MCEGGGLTYSLRLSGGCGGANSDTNKEQVATQAAAQAAAILELVTASRQSNVTLTSLFTLMRFH